MHTSAIIDLHGGGRERLTSRPVDRFSICEVVLLHNSYGETVRVEGLCIGRETGFANVDCVVDRVVSIPNFGSFALATVELSGGETHPLCVRSRLRQAESRLEDSAGWSARVGFECEFLLNPQSFAGNDASVRNYYGEILDGGTIGRYFTEVLESATAAGVLVESIYREYECTQFEITTPPMAALDAADNFFFLKRILRLTAARLNLNLDMRPQPFNGIFGNGLHINLSLVELESGMPWKHNLSGTHAASLSLHLEQATLAYASTPNSYARLGNTEFAIYSSLWSLGRRDSLLRIVGEDRKHHLEIRLPDPSCNVHLALIDLLHAITKSDPGDLEASARAPLLPGSLGDAIERFGQSDTTRTALGEAMTDTFVAMKRSESARLSKDTTQ